MAVVKVIELMSDSKKSWEDAAQKAVNRAGESVKRIKSIWVKDFSATTDDDGKINNYRVTVKLSFEVKG